MRDINNLFSSYSGFSSVNTEGKQSWAKFDIDLIRCDLMNHFQTRVGERVMRPDFGCKIWDWLMEPMTPLLREMIINETVRIFQSDARVALREVRVLESDNGIRIECTLDYIGFVGTHAITVDFSDSSPLNTITMET